LPASRHACLPDDVLDLRSAVFGEDLVLSRQPDGCYVLYQIADDGRADQLGTYDDIVEVWKVIDAIDTADEHAVAA
jgi:hypothetical protein